MNPVLRLGRYALPYRLRLGGASLSMAVYAAASGGLAYQFKPIFDSVLPSQAGFITVASAIMLRFI